MEHHCGAKAMTSYSTACAERIRHPSSMVLACAHAHGQRSLPRVIFRAARYHSSALTCAGFLSFERSFRTTKQQVLAIWKADIACHGRHCGPDDCCKRLAHGATARIRRCARAAEHRRLRCLAAPPGAGHCIVPTIGEKESASPLGAACVGRASGALGVWTSTAGA